jgi:hypothetical protein
MTNHLMRPTALALSLLVSAGCSETTTQPETTEAPTATPELAVATNSWLTKADMFGTTRSSLATATVTNAAGQSVLYAIGGVTEAGGSLSRSRPTTSPPTAGPTGPRCPFLSSPPMEPA